MSYKQSIKNYFKGPEGKNFPLERMRDMLISNTKLTEEFSDRQGVPFYTAPKEKILENTKIVEIPNSGFEVKVHYNNLTISELNQVEKNIISTYQAYKKLYGLETYDYDETPELNLYIFDNNDDYLNTRLNLQLTDYNGMTRGYFNGFFDMAVFKASNMTDAIAHELSHAFTGFTTNNLVIGDDSLAENRSLKVGKLVETEQKTQIENIEQKMKPTTQNHEIEFDEVDKKTEFVNSKFINVRDTKFKIKVEYDQLNDKQIDILEKYINHIFNAYKAKYTLKEFSDEEMRNNHLKNNTFELKVFNNLGDFQKACNRTFSSVVGDYHYCDKSAHVSLREGFENTLAHEFAHALSDHNYQKSGIPGIEDREGHRLGDAVYKFGKEIGNELCSIKQAEFSQQNNNKNIEKLIREEDQQITFFETIKGIAASIIAWISSWFFDSEESDNSNVNNLGEISYEDYSGDVLTNEHDLI
ncbi:MAG: hypothetical protein QWI36_01860 [Wolbachia endosymbiont of Tyrophagus putrescentiae]|nr:hypothetical protein [Wolbachia endosymbiont of Tyrophagus putrescentiae]